MTVPPTLLLSAAYSCTAHLCMRSMSPTRTSGKEAADERKRLKLTPSTHVGSLSVTLSSASLPDVLRGAATALTTPKQRGSTWAAHRRTDGRTTGCEMSESGEHEADVEQSASVSVSTAQLCRER